ncbi:MAG: hypothetical protein PF495_05675 [Spirochaetales bacterium]|jgi:hypothetical protein|nr:hypothetical protein [Spirochaetales bacterium]
MQIETAWVKPPRRIKGLDHLAVQAPCINIYGKLLPGITNVTDRARYYSFYPWLVWALEEKGHVFDDHFIDLFRKADCLFTLIAHRHADISGNAGFHAGATIGTNNLVEQLHAIKEKKSVTLSDYAHRDKDRKKYFKNTLGGLGQYYLGVLSELNIMNGTAGSGIQNTKQVGKQVAQAFAKGVNGDLFLQSVGEDLVTLERLDALAAFCPCQIENNPEEHKLLFDMFFVQGPLFNEPDLLPRRRTLQTILYVADGLAKQGLSITEQLFRGCVYSQSFPNGLALELPESLHSNLNRWGIYQRNELLSLAVQGLFYVLLDCYAESGHRLPSSKDVCEWFMGTPEVAQTSKRFDLEKVLSQAVQDYGKQLPEFTAWTDPEHEVQHGLRVEALSRTGGAANRALILESCVATLLALSFREQTGQGYGDLIFPGKYFQYYPINLRSFNSHSANTWQDHTVKQWLTWLCETWGLEAHLKVALRKLRGQSQSSFRIRPSDYGMVVVDPDEIPPAVFTSPRFRQAIQVLQDVGVLAQQDGCLRSTTLGITVKEAIGV